MPKEKAISLTGNMSTIAPRPPARKHEGTYERNDKVLVARSNGGWTEAVVSSVDEKRREYSVCFSNGSKAVHKQIAFDHARDHLLPVNEQSTYYSKITKVPKAEIEGICHEIFKGRELQDVLQHWMRKRSGSNFLTPQAVRRLGRFTDSVGELIEHLFDKEGSKMDEYKLIADWAAGKVTPLPASSPVNASRQAPSPAPAASPSPSPSPNYAVERIDRDDSPEVEMSEAASPSPPRHPALLGWDAMRADLQKMAVLAEDIHKSSQIGSPSDKDLELRAQKLQQRGELKDKVVTELDTIEGKERPPEDMVPMLRSLLSTTCREGDQESVNSALVRGLIGKVDAGFAEVIQSEGLLIDQCTDGNIEFFKALLSCEGVHGAYDPVEVIAAAVYSPSARVPLVIVVLDSVEYRDVIDDVQPYFNELFTSLTTESQRKNKEDTTRLYELLETLVTHDVIKIDLPATDTSEMNVFSRCCASGDMKLLDMLSKRAPHIILPTDELADGTTPLIQAIIKDKGDIVKRLIAFPKCEIDKESKLGTALGLADAMKRTEIETILREAGATASKFNGG
eukprot:TRINITY_DN1613_c0_g1_i1.p1 TRINITY_DN1613_c0_g1~~TRINITY_DN1613_c0_g1_i1.p1  ORF type:complete len:566 (+),score=101.48 TRINITY_DN1613_c0_g1_i1:2433-4130(+)